MKDIPERIRITVPTGTAPIRVVSTTVCPNLNADKLDGIDSTGFALASTGLLGAEQHEKVFRSPLTTNLAFLLVTDVAYWVYVGRVQACTPKKIRFYIRTAGVGTQTAELCLASTPSAPNGAAQTLTKIEATGSVNALTGTGVVTNTSDFSTAVAAGTYLWAGIRTAMTVTQPQILGLGMDDGDGYILSTATAGALTGASSWTGALIATSLSGVCPELAVRLF